MDKRRSGPLNRTDVHRDLHGEDGDMETLDLLESRTQTATLPIGADRAYELFSTAEFVQNWVSVVSSVRVLDRNGAGQPTRVAFIAKLVGGSIGYSLRYDYDDTNRRVSWASDPNSAPRVAGRAYFLPLGGDACLMHYELSLELPGDALPPWEEPFFDSNAAARVVTDFREYVNRDASNH